MVLLPFAHDWEKELGDMRAMQGLQQCRVCNYNRLLFCRTAQPSDKKSLSFWLSAIVQMLVQWTALNPLPILFPCRWE